MGGSAGKLGIGLERETMYSGTPINGIVYLQLEKEVEIGGNEKSHVHWVTTTTHSDGRGGSQTTTHHHHAYAKRALFRVVVPIHGFKEGRLLPGRYEFPFSALLPRGLPTTMYAHGGGGDCQIKYYINAKLTRPGMMNFDLKTTRPFMVSSTPMPPEAVPAFLQPSETKVSTCWCLGKGAMTLGATLDDTLIGRGESVRVGLALKNDSTATVDKISACVTEFVNWHAGGHSNNHKRKIAQVEFDLSSIHGVDKLDQAALKAVREAAAAGLSQTYEELYQQLAHGKQRSLLSISADARDSYAGAVLSVRHQLEVRLETACCVTNPSVQTIVRIGAPAPPPAVATPVLGQALPVATPVQTYLPIAVPVVNLPVAVPLSKDEKEAVTTMPADWNSATVAEAVVVPMGAAVVGTAAEETTADNADNEDIPVVQAVLVHPERSLAGLHERLSHTLDDFDLIAELASDPLWDSVFAQLTPADFALIVATVGLEYDQPRAAEVMAKKLSGGLTCEHISATLSAAAAAYRAAMVHKLAPLCVDLQQNKALIVKQLSQWERVITESDLK